MTVKELIEQLKTYPPETEVSVLRSKYYGPAEVIPLTTEEFDFTDFEGNKFAKEGSKHYNKKYLTLGDEYE